MKRLLIIFIAVLFSFPAICQNKKNNTVSVRNVNGNRNIIAGGSVYIHSHDDNNVGVLNGGNTNKKLNYSIPILKLGNDGFLFTKGSKGDITKLDSAVFRGIDLKFWIDNGKLKIDNTVRNRYGEILAIIRNNEWQVNSNLILDKNYNDTSLEVLGVKGEVILQVELRRKQKAIEIAGIFYREDSTGVMLANCKQHHKPSAIFIKLNENPKSKLVPIFEYPSKLHPGQRNGNQLYVIPE